jgi:hypothetical protein
MIFIVPTIINMKLLARFCHSELEAVFFFGRRVCDSVEVVSSMKLVALLIANPIVITAALAMEFIGFNNKVAL